MRLVKAHLKSLAPYSQSKPIGVPEEPKESKDEYERRTWREHCHTDAEGNVCIPALAFKNCLSAAAKYLGMQIPGKGRKTYTRHFEAGILVLEALSLPVRKDAVQGEWFFMPANGVRGAGKRVMRCYPMIPSWEGQVIFHILDDTITPEVFEEHLREAGRFIGIGRFRPERNGVNGRFEVIGCEWTK